MIVVRVVAVVRQWMWLSRCTGGRGVITLEVDLGGVVSLALAPMPRVSSSQPQPSPKPIHRCNYLQAPLSPRRCLAAAYCLVDLWSPCALLFIAPRFGFSSSYNLRASYELCFFGAFCFWFYVRVSLACVRGIAGKSSIQSIEKITML